MTKSPNGKPEYTPKADNINIKKRENFYNDGKWTIKEHRAFLIGILIYGSYWKGVHKLVETRTLRQTMSHSQKFFMKINKLNFISIYNYSAKELRAYSRCLNHEEIIQLIEKLTKIYLKKHEILFYTLIDEARDKFPNENKYNTEDISKIFEYNPSYFQEHEKIILRKNSNKDFLKNLYNINLDNDSIYCIRQNNTENRTNSYSRFVHSIDNNKNSSIITDKSVNIIDNSNSINCEYSINEHNLNSDLLFLNKFLDFCNKGIFHINKKNNENEENAMFYNQSQNNLETTLTQEHLKKKYCYYPIPEVCLKIDNSDTKLDHEHSLKSNASQYSTCEIGISEYFSVEENFFISPSYTASEIIMEKNNSMLQKKMNFNEINIGIDFKDHNLTSKLDYDVVYEKIFDSYNKMESEDFHNIISSEKNNHYNNDETLTDYSFMDC